MNSQRLLRRYHALRESDRMNSLTKAGKLLMHLLFVLWWCICDCDGLQAK